MTMTMNRTEVEVTQFAGGNYATVTVQEDPRGIEYLDRFAMELIEKRANVQVEEIVFGDGLEVVNHHEIPQRKFYAYPCYTEADVARIEEAFRFVLED